MGRKESGWLKLFLSLEESNTCDHWKEKYRVARRKKNDYLYLIENDKVRSLERSERKRKEKLEKEASDRLNKEWDAEWEIEKKEQQRIWNETHDENGNLIENEEDDDQEGKETEKEEEKPKDDAEVPKRYW